jgi:hypothetical protein
MPQVMVAKDQWNILEQAWIDAAALDGAWRMLSPLDALRDAGSLRLLAASSPLDEFALHRFLSTLLYWKAESAGGVAALRTKLLAGGVPAEVIAALAAERGQFDLFDPARPFLQDPSAADPKPAKPVGSLFAEIATGTNIAHFDHSRDMKSPLCVPCVVRGVLRLVPWSQSGGAGLTPSIHGAPPITITPRGATLAETLGLLLVDVSAPLGSPTWSGTFKPRNLDKAIPFLEGLTWNPRRLHIPAPTVEGACQLCGARGPVVDRITYKKNESVKKPKGADGKSESLGWRDPAFVYSAKTSEPIRSSSESSGATAEDLRWLHGASAAASGAPSALSVVVPCTNPANNKTYDHRRIEVGALSELVQRRPAHHGADALPLDDKNNPLGEVAVGWKRSAVAPAVRTSIGRFVSAAVAALSDADWLLLRHALGRPMNDDPEAFAVFSAVYWRVRSGGRSSFRREAAWILLKLMALAPSHRRSVSSDALLAPLLEVLPRKQASRTRSEEAGEEPYPVAPPRGHALELALASAVDEQITRGTSIAWVELGAFLHNSSR